LLMSDYLPTYGTQVSGPVCFSVGRRIKGRWLWPLRLSWRVYVYKYNITDNTYKILYSTWNKRKALIMYNKIISGKDNNFG
jgi:hypothetical protein